MKKTSVSELVSLLRQLGLCSGDRVLIHSNFSSLGLVPEGPAGLLDALNEVLGSEGTLIVPAFTFSFCRNEVFNPRTSVATTGVFANLVLSQPSRYRTVHPNHSFVALGVDADKVVEFRSPTSFGKGSSFESMLEHDVKVLLLGVFQNSFVHYVEQFVGVPYRYEKKFSGVIEEEGRQREETFSFYVRREGICGTEEEDRKPAREIFFAQERCRSVRFAYGMHRLFSGRYYCDFMAEKLREDRLFLVDKASYNGPIYG